jgi:hypothetical protein
MKNYGLLPILILILVIISCDTEKNDKIVEQEIYFEYYYVNFAWGPAYAHWIIDSQGNVRVNKNQDSIIWINPKNLNSYVEMFDSIIFKIDKSDFDKYVSIIPRAAKGKVLETEQHRADFGGYVFNCYTIYENSYKMVLLSEMSDVIDRTNLDSNAVQIDAWLKGLNNEIYSYPEN